MITLIKIVATIETIISIAVYVFKVSSAIELFILLLSIVLKMYFGSLLR